MENTETIRDSLNCVTQKYVFKIKVSVWSVELI